MSKGDLRCLTLSGSCHSSVVVIFEDVKGSDSSKLSSATHTIYWSETKPNSFKRVPDEVVRLYPQPPNVPSNAREPSLALGHWTSHHSS